MAYVINSRNVLKSHESYSVCKLLLLLLLSLTTMYTDEICKAVVSQKKKRDTQ